MVVCHNDRSVTETNKEGAVGLLHFHVLYTPTVSILPMKPGTALWACVYEVCTLLPLYKNVCGYLLLVHTYVCVLPIHVHMLW